MLCVGCLLKDLSEIYQFKKYHIDQYQLFRQQYKDIGHNNYPEGEFLQRFTFHRAQTSTSQAQSVIKKQNTNLLAYTNEPFKQVEEIQTHVDQLMKWNDLVRETFN